MTRFFKVRYLILLTVTLFGVPMSLRADIGVDLDAKRLEYLLYERLDIRVIVKNSSSHTLDMKKSAGNNPWLELSVSSRHDDEIARTTVPWNPPDLIVPGGEAKTVNINITPLFMIREPDEYKVTAHIHVGDEEFTSRPLRISVSRGQPIWKQRYTAEPDPNDAQKKERPRLYSLMVHSDGNNELLYVRIMDPIANRVYCTTDLGSFVNYADPKTRIDLKGDLHVLHQSGTRIFTYTEFDPNGKLVKSRFFSNLGSEPDLVATSKGETDVVGGEEIFKNGNGMMDIIPTAPEMKSPPHDADFQVIDKKKK